MSSIVWAEDLFHPGLPKSIQDAMRVAGKNFRFTRLGDSAHKVLVYLVSLLNANDFSQPVYPRKSTIANRLGLSRSTVFRCLKHLETADLILRDSQGREEESQKFEVVDIRFTDLVIDVLEEFEEEETTEIPKESENSESADVTDAGTRATAVPPLDGPCLTVTHGTLLYTGFEVPYGSKCADAARGKAAFTPPADLGWLVNEKHLTPGQLVTILAKARKAGAWLQDILDLRGHAIRAGGCRNVFAYLLALIKSNTDWAYLKKIRASEREAKRKDESVKQQIEHATLDLRNMAGRFLANADRTAIYKLNDLHADVWWIEDGGPRKGVDPMNPRFVEAFTTGKLTEVDAAQAMELVSKWFS